MARRFAGLPPGKKLVGGLPKPKSGFIGGKGKGRGRGKGKGNRHRFGPAPIGFGRGFLRGN